jgi:hypothetical protein
MTVVVTVVGPETIWLLADRRLSYDGRPAKDDARKLMFLETQDGEAFLGYAGLGATANGTEPADWMAAVLRGRDLPLEHCLGALAEAMKKQLPRHVVQLPVPGHNVIVPAFVGNEARVYTIDLAYAPDRKTYRLQCTRRAHASGKPPRVIIGGSGAWHLVKNKKWIRPLLRIVRANDRGRVSTNAVADHLANLNYEIHLGLDDKTVGPNCIVAWHHRKNGVHKGGGGQRFYTGTTRAESSNGFPVIVAGMALNPIMKVMMPHIRKYFAATNAGKRAPELDRDVINAELARLPHKPDENLK